MSPNDHGKGCPGSICGEAANIPAICSCDAFDPRCETCGAPITTGLMAVFCPRGRACEFWLHDEESDAFLTELRGHD